MERATVKAHGAITGFEQHRRSAKASNRRFMAAGAVIAVAAVALVFVAMQGTSVYYVSISEFHNKQAATDYATKEVRVAGKVIPGSIAHTGDAVTFLAKDKTDPGQTMKVSYTKLVPDTFKDDAEVVVTGTYKDGLFNANEMLAKCPSKYSSSADAEANK